MPTLDRTSSTNAKVAALEAYFREAPPEDAAWTVFFLAGRRLLRLLPTQAAARVDGGHRPGSRRGCSTSRTRAVGRPRRDARAAARRRARGGRRAQPCRCTSGSRSGSKACARSRPTRSAQDVVHWWRALPSFERFLLNKLLTGEMRVGVSQTLVVRALAAVAGVETDVMTHRLMGQWSPSAQAFAAPDGAGRLGRRGVAPLSVLPGVSARTGRRVARAARRTGRPSGNGTASGRS